MSDVRVPDAELRAVLEKLEIKPWQIRTICENGTNLNSFMMMTDFEIKHIFIESVAEKVCNARDDVLEAYIEKNNAQFLYLVRDKLNDKLKETADLQKKAKKYDDELQKKAKKNDDEIAALRAFCQERYIPEKFVNHMISLGVNTLLKFSFESDRAIDEKFESFQHDTWREWFMKNLKDARDAAVDLYKKHIDEQCFLLMKSKQADIDNLYHQVTKLNEALWEEKGETRQQHKDFVRHDEYVRAKENAKMCHELLKDRDSEIEMCQELVKERDSKIKKRDREIVNLESQIENLLSSVENVEKENVRLKSTIRQLDQKIVNIKESTQPIPLAFTSELLSRLRAL